MTSSNAITDPATVVDAPTESIFEAVDGDATAPSLTNPSPFELLPTGESFGVCDVDGVCS